MNWKNSYIKWIIAAIILFILGMISTILYNLPSNVTIFTAGDPNLIDVTQVRKDFNEEAWIDWNHFRAATTSLAMLCLTCFLHLTSKKSNLSSPHF